MCATETYSHGNELQIPACTKYFMENLQRLSDANYVPTEVFKICHSIGVCKDPKANSMFYLVCVLQPRILSSWRVLCFRFFLIVPTVRVQNIFKIFSTKFEKVITIY